MEEKQTSAIGTARGAIGSVASTAVTAAGFGFSSTLNILWIVFSLSIIPIFLLLFVGTLFGITYVGLPAAGALFSTIKLYLLPFGTKSVPYDDPSWFTVILGLLWLPFGSILMFFHLIMAALSAVTGIGLPFAYIHAKLATHVIWPFNKRTVYTVGQLS